jgi:CRISPR-associated protein Cas1
MGALYLTANASSVRKVGETLVVYVGKEKRATVPLHALDRVLVFGRAQFSSSALDALLRNGIDTAFLTSKGRLRGRLQPPGGKNVFLRLAQYETFRSSERSLELARALVASKVRSQADSLQRAGKRIDDAKLAATVKRLRATAGEVLRHEGEIPSLMGHEGAASALYFDAFPSLLRCALTFPGRQRRPPPDPVNALLSLSYTLITNELAALVEADGFDPMLGFLHGVRCGRVSLALDLVEEFRHRVADRFVLVALNTRFIRAEHFDRCEDGGLRLNEESFARAMQRFEREMRTARAPSGLSPRQLLRRQVARLRRFVMQESSWLAVDKEDEGADDGIGE